MKAIPGSANHVTSERQAKELGQRLIDHQRTHPSVVITLDKAGCSSFNPDDIASALKFRADVWVVDDAGAWTVNQGLGGETVYGRAAGVFPPRGHGRLRRHLFTEAEGHTDDIVIAKARECAPGRAASARTSAPVATSQQPVRPRAGLHVIETVDHVDALSAHLLSPDRDRPVAVVTIPMHRTEPWIDPQEIVDAVGPEAEVHLIATGARTFQLTARLNRMAGVYGGAGRVYGMGTEWLVDPLLSPLRFAYDKGEGRRATGELINDLLGGLARAGRLTSESTPAERRVRGTVSGLVPPSRAIVTLDDDTHATVSAELTVPGLDINAILARNLTIVGRLDPDTRRVDIREMLRSAQDALADLAHGDVVYARVEDVTSRSVTLTPYPGTRAVVAVEFVTGNELDDLTELLSAGEVVSARYLGADDPKNWRLSLIDVDDDEDATLLSLIPTGPPWLEGRSVDPADTAAPTDEPIDDHEQQRLESALAAAETRLREVDTTAGQFGDLTRRVAELEAELSSRDLLADALQRDLRDSRRQITRLEHSITQERRSKRRYAQKASSKGASVKEVHGYIHPCEQMRWDLTRTWVEQTRPEDKARWPLPTDYRIGPDFCGSVDELEGVSRERVLLVAVRVLTGRDVFDDHPLRSSKAGGASAVTRKHDGVEWICRRAPLQQSSPSARRLSYWRSPAGQVELSRVTVHDDLTP